MQLHIPGKTFLVGEYLALHEGPVLVALTGPSFSASFFRHEGSQPEQAADFHPMSPAGRFMRLYPSAFYNLKIKFVDYIQKGGLGASTAQFLAVYAWSLIAQGQNPLETDIDDLLGKYRECAYDGQGIPPSGADLVGQLKGSLCYFDRRQKQIRQFQWPFPQLELMLVHTGHKLATHEHLRSVEDFNSQGLLKAFEKCYEGLLEKDEALFCEGVNDYAEELYQLGFTCQNSLDLLGQIRKLPGVRAAKACGAMGVDVLAVIVDKNVDVKNENSPGLLAYLKQQGLQVMATDADICEGLKYE